MKKHFFLQPAAEPRSRANQESCRQCRDAASRTNETVANDFRKTLFFCSIMYQSLVGQASAKKGIWG
jgi:hypothetical protein